jgi:hypothetical protein
MNVRSRGRQPEGLLKTFLMEPSFLHLSAFAAEENDGHLIGADFAVLVIAAVFAVRLPAGIIFRGSDWLSA